MLTNSDVNMRTDSHDPDPATNIFQFLSDSTEQLWKQGCSSKRMARESSAWCRQRGLHFKWTEIFLGRSACANVTFCCCCCCLKKEDGKIWFKKFMCMCGLGQSQKFNKFTIYPDVNILYLSELCDKPVKSSHWNSLLGDHECFHRNLRKSMQ